MKSGKRFFLCLAILTLALPEIVVAGGVSGKVSTLGMGLEYTQPLGDKVAVRLGANAFNYDKSFDEESDSGNGGFVMDAKAEFRTVSLIADYHPFGGIFKLSGGAMYNGNKLTADIEPYGTGTYEFNGVEYTVDEIGNADASVDFKSFSPYLGLGWSKSPKGTGLGFSFEVGAMYQGEPSLDMNVTCSGTLPAAQCNQLQADVAVEKADVQDDLNDFKWYPVISAGISYHF